MKKKRSTFIIVLILIGVILFGVVAFVVVRATASVTAIVPNQTIKAGTVVEESMIDYIQVPVNSPTGYITDKNSIVGQKLKTEVSKNQLLYINNIVKATDYREGESIPKDYTITSIKLPPERTVGGLVSVGDTVDILGVPNNSYNTSEKSTMENYLGAIAKDSYGADGNQVYWVLSNVKILEINTVNDDGNSSKESDSENVTDSEGAYYVVALSYDDLKRVRLSEQYLDLWMSIAPSYNDDHDPLLDEMRDRTIKELQDAQAQSKIKEEKKVTKDETDEQSTTASDKNND